MGYEIVTVVGRFELAKTEDGEHAVLFQGALCTLATEGLDIEPGFDRALEWARS